MRGLNELVPGADVRRQETIRTRLLSWFDAEARQLPWRTTPRDPYAVWISEVMLQQTRVSAVIPYYHRFLERFPSVRALADAHLDQVLSAWSGLGYYRRARALHDAARAIMERHDGSMPGDLAALRALPGIGAYTSAAIASIAFGARVAVVDGNVQRVVSRVYAIEQPVDGPPGRKLVDGLAQVLVHPERPGAFNEAMMELGAMVCSPKRPSCASCPLHQACEANERGLQESLPVTARRTASPRVQLSCMVVQHGQQTLLGRRRETGLFGGLWEPLLFEGGEQEAIAALRQTWPRARAREAGALEHVLTHRVLAVRVWVIAVRSQREPPAASLPASYERVAWLGPEQWEGAGMSALARRALQTALRWRDV